MNYVVQAIPVFFVLIGVEWLVCRLQNRRDYYRLNDTVSDLSLGVVDQVGGALLKAGVFGVYLYIYHNWRSLELSGTSMVAWTGCLLAYDLGYYWAHRASHTINIMWGSHIPHHSSEEYNLSVALRQGVFQGFFFWVFYLPLALIGFPPAIFVVCGQIDTLYQFWIHTRTIGRLGPLEWVMNTPSHHRVHHGKNPKYIDKNHGGIFIIWDRLFGTFQEEEEEPLYGTVKPLRSWNPAWASIHYWVDLAKLAWRAPRVVDKFLIWFMPPAWRPRGLENAEAGRDLSREFTLKYNTVIPAGLKAYVLCQFIPLLVGASVFLGFERTMTPLARTISGGLILLTLVNLGGILEAKQWVRILEPLRLVGAAAIIVVWAAQGSVSGPVGVATIGVTLTLAATFLMWLGRYWPALRNEAGALPKEAEMPLAARRTQEMGLGAGVSLPVEGASGQL